MGKTILTPKQFSFLELAAKEPQITKRFYLTGGTALSEFYFKHRLSADLGLFSERQVNPAVIDSFLKSISGRLGVAKVIKENVFGLYTYKFQYNDGDILKVDFNYYPFPKIEKGIYFGKLEVSSVYDIAVNKLHTIGMKPRARDYIDLYFIFKKSEYEAEKYLNRMRIDSQAKFDWLLEVKYLVTAFLRVKDFSKDEFPKMLVNFDPKDMERFFLSEAKKLEKGIFIS